MPYVIRPPRRRAQIVGLVCAGLLASTAPPAAAAAKSDGCPTTPTIKAFKLLGDNADYSLVPGGHFELGTSGWSLTKAAVVPGNASFKVRAATDTKSLSIQPGGAVASPRFCAGVEHPTFRFFARQTSGTPATLSVSLRWTSSNGKTRETKVGELDGKGFGFWQPSPILALTSALPYGQAKKSVDVSLVFQSQGGTWAIDDVYVDPYRR